MTGRTPLFRQLMCLVQQFFSSPDRALRQTRFRLNYPNHDYPSAQRRQFIKAGIDTGMATISAAGALRALGTLGVLGAHTAGCQSLSPVNPTAAGANGLNSGESESQKSFDATTSKDAGADSSAAAKHKHHDIVILGGGLAGLTAAYELSKASTSGATVAVYEGANRWGGRVFSFSPFTADGLVCELGGEFIDSNHNAIQSLCRELNISLINLNASERGLEKNLYYFSGKYYTDRDVLQAFPPFAARFLQDLKTPTRDIDQMTIAEYLTQMATSQVQPWLIDLFRVAYLGEFGLELDKVSALLLFWTLSPETQNGFHLYGESDQGWRIKGGNSTLVTGLVQKLHKNPNVDLFKSHMLIGIRQSSRGLALQFATPDYPADRPYVVYARQVICALPFSVLRNVEGFLSLDLDSVKKRAIRELVYGTNAKLMFGFKKRIWRRRGGIKKDNITIPASIGMIYTDLISQNIWDTSRGQRGLHGILTTYLGGVAGAQIDNSRHEDYLQAIQEILPGSKKLFDNSKISFNWSNYPFTRGSYSSAAPGQITEFGQVTQQNELNGQLIFAGEHTSEVSSGFMDGACASGLRAAREALALRPMFSQFFEQHAHL